MPDVDYSKIDDGLGGTYERIAYCGVLERLAKKYKVKKILELNSTFIAGAPAFNSGILVQDGFDVTITVHSRDYKDGVEAWKIAGMLDKVKIVEWNNDLKTDFKDNGFDMVWNHLAFEHYKDPMPLIKEMKRLSRNLVVNFTLSPLNPGFPLHWLMHKLSGTKWDHGYVKNSLISSMEKAHSECGLQLIESDGTDVPPWMDTVDLEVGGSMRYVRDQAVGEKWVWGATNPKAKNHWLVKMLLDWELSYPRWFRIAVAHHLYAASRKVK